MQPTLLGAPWLLVHKSMLTVNQPRKICLYGNDYVMSKARSGTIHAFSKIYPSIAGIPSKARATTEHDNVKTDRVYPDQDSRFDAQGCAAISSISKATEPQSQPLDLIVQGDFVWSYGGYAPKLPIPSVFNTMPANYYLIGHTAEQTFETDAASLVSSFQDSYRQNYSKTRTQIENHNPSVLILHGELPLGKIAQCHLFIPETLHRTRTYILLFGQAQHPAFKWFDQAYLKFSEMIYSV